MLEVTENAAAMIRSLLDRPDIPDTAGVRISKNGGLASELTIDSAAIPEPGDQVIDQEGARVFVGSEAAEILDDKALDASVEDDGTITFLLAQQHA